MMTMVEAKTFKELEVHCLSCDQVFTEHLGIIVDVCPHCGNPDMMNTVYVQQEESNDVRLA
jgi:Zn finger protein HypA/HybF involved in hydrogenase expression